MYEIRARYLYEDWKVKEFMGNSICEPAIGGFRSLRCERVDAPEEAIQKWLDEDAPRANGLASFETGVFVTDAELSQM